MMNNTAQKFDATFAFKTPAKAASTFTTQNPKATLDKDFVAADYQRLEYESGQKDAKLQEKDEEIGRLAAEKAEKEDENTVLKRALARTNSLLNSKVKENCRLRHANNIKDINIRQLGDALLFEGRNHQHELLEKNQEIGDLTKRAAGLEAKLEDAESAQMDPRTDGSKLKRRKKRHGN